METVRLGDRGPSVRKAQEMLNAANKAGLKVDGIFGPKTEDAVVAFQKKRRIYTDGVVGPVTWGELTETYDGPTGTLPDVDARYALIRVHIAKQYKGKGYKSFRIREDVAEGLELVASEMESVGAHLTSSGGTRGLTAPVGSNRSATSFHYTGRAVDLYLYSGMVDPHEAPFVCTRDPEDDRKFIVWARAKRGAPMSLDAVLYEKAEKSTGYPQRIVTTEGRFINFTELMRQEGFERISARRSFFRWGRKNNGGAEWWHFQYERGLVPGESTFGEELLKIYPKSTLEGTPPWKYRHYRFGKEWN